MSTDELRRMLDYPDDSVVLDLPAITARARRHQVRRRRLGAAAGLVCAVGAVTAVYLGALSGSEPRTAQVIPADDGTPSASPSGVATPSPAAPSPSTAASISPAPALTAPGATRVPMGQGWRVWVRPNGELCRSAPNDKGHGARLMPFGCRSTTDGNITGVSIQSSGSVAGAMYSAVIPYGDARVDLIIGGEHVPAATVHFDRLKDWTFYFLWVPGAIDPANFGHVGVVAFDSAGKEIAKVGAH